MRGGAGEGYDRMMRRAIVLAFLMFGCPKDRPANDAASGTPPPGGPLWLDVFAVYPNLRLKHEFHSLLDLHHPNLVSLGELVSQGNQWFFTMELVDGADFYAYVRPDALDEARLRSALPQLARGLAARHAAGMVHRDVKPTNVMVDGEGRVVLLDFGLAANVSDRARAGETHAVGTAEYMAPEQAASKPVGPEADWYSVGVVLYEALTGKLPYQGSSLEVLMDKQRYEPPPPRAVSAGVPADLDALCVDLLRFDPSARPSGRDVLRRLGAEDVVRGAPPSSSLHHRAPFIGRQRELDALARAFEDTREGTPVTVVVSGESGVGKSALVRRFLKTFGAEKWGLSPFMFYVPFMSDQRIAW